MKVLEELLAADDLRRAGFTHFIGLTYGVDLAWFERHLRRQLELAGVRRTAVFADRRALDATLAAQLNDLLEAGLAFAVQGVPAAITFHPKAYLLAGPRAARLYVGSGNLNEGGLAHQREIFERWDARPEEPVPRVFDAYRAFLGGLLGTTLPALPHLGRIVQGAFALAPFGGPFAEQGGAIHGSPGPLFDRLPAPPTPATRLVMTAPFFDSEGRAARDLATRLRAERFEVLVDRTMTNLTFEARTAIEASGGRVLALVDERRSHAKVLFAEGAGWAFSAHGSANLSQAAWRGHNAELMVFREGAAAQEIKGLLVELAGKALTAEEWAVVHERAAKTSAPGADGVDVASDLALQSARTVEAGRLEIILGGRLVDGAALQLRAADGALEFPLRAGGPGEAILLDLVPTAGRVAMARLVQDGRTGPWTLIHDPGALERAARGRTVLDDRLERLVLSGGRDPDGGAALLELITDLMRLRSGARQGAPISTERRAKANGGDGPEWRWLRPDGAIPATEEPEAPEVLQAAIGYGQDPVRLIERMVLGDARTMIGRSDNSTDTDTGAGAEAGEQRTEGNRKPLDRPLERATVDLVEAAERARAAFVAALEHGGGELPAENLLADVLILAATLQSGLQVGRMTDGAYAHAMKDVLRAAFGNKNAPLVRALGRIADEDRERAWTRGWLLVGPLLALWQVLLAHLASSGEDGAEDAARRENLVLWVRHVLRHRPPGSTLDSLLAEAKRQLPAIERYGALWLGDRWPALVARLPFVPFARKLLGDALALLSAEPLLHAALGHASKARLSGLEEQAIVIGIGRDGALAKGFMDDERTALLQDGAFLSESRQEFNWRLRRLDDPRVLPLGEALDMLAAGGPELHEATRVLEELDA